MSSPNDKGALIARIASTRTALSRDLEGLGHALDVPGRLRSSFRLHPLAWVAGAVGAGILAAILFRRNGKDGGLSPWRPMLMGTLGFLGNRALTLSLPALREVLDTELTRWLDRRRPAATATPTGEGRVSL
jgi:hypothetical protein